MPTGSDPGTRLACLGLERVDGRDLFKAEPDVIQPVQQAVLLERVDVEVERLPVGRSD